MTDTNVAKLREPFPENQISYLPKGGVKLAYVGHAALTDRLLDTDPAWTWEPLALDDRGLPALDERSGLWIRLTVCGVTRLGYGHAGTKTGGDAVKELIGDALRNAAMRFGAALDLWHKGDLHAHQEQAPEPENQERAARQAELDEMALYMIECHKDGKDIDAIKVWNDPSSFDSNQEVANEEKVYLWGLLKKEPSLRGIIKANKPMVS